MAKALAALDARVPLGATDMTKAIEAVVDSYGGESKRRVRRFTLATGEALPIYWAPRSLKNWPGN